jgi:hypothetical protein
MFDKLAAEFPRDAVSWRAQSVTKDGKKAMALAYIDARDVMERLDGVCGPGNWQDRYEFAGPRTICYLSIKIDGEWVTKADGAGDTAVEAEKGAISDAFKRAAVKWGVGRYLYALDAPWVPCECGEWNGKKQWKRWTADPWSFVKGASKTNSVDHSHDSEPADPSPVLEALIANMPTTSIEDADAWKDKQESEIGGLSDSDFEVFKRAWQANRKALAAEHKQAA